MKKLLDLIVQKELQGVEENIGFSSNIFMIFGLPTQKPKDNSAFWKKETSYCTFTLTRDEKYEIPYGCYARMNQIFIDTEICTKKTHIIEAGRSFAEFTHKLGYHDGKASYTLLRQLLNYVTCSIKVEPKNLAPNHFMGVHSFVARAWDIHFDVKNPEQLMLFKGQIILDKFYAEWVQKHAVPLDMNVVRCFKRNPTSLDFYRVLAYRNNNLKRTVSIPDRQLFEQLGTQEAEDKVTRMRLQRTLKTLQMYWPVRAKFEDGFLILEPSPPAVQKKISRRKPLAITQKPQETTPASQ